MKKQKKNKQKNNIIYVIAAVVAVIIMVSGSTYAYWQWISATNQQTNVNVVVRGATMTITGDNATSTTLRPTNDCDGVAALVSQEATVTVVNETGTQMRATPRLDIILTPAQGTLTSTILSHIHWAVVDITATPTGTCTSTEYQGTLDKLIRPTITVDNTTKDISVSYSSVTPVSASTASGATTTFDLVKNISSFKTGLTDANRVANTLSFVANPATINQQGVTTPVTTTNKYKVYVWIDETYAGQNVGGTVSDPLQNITISVKWSTKSTLFQI